MIGRSSLKYASRSPPLLALNGNPHLVFPSHLRPPPQTSIFRTAPLPTALFDEPNLSVLRASPKDRVYDARFLLLQSASFETHELDVLAAKAFPLRMWNWVQIVTTPTADTHGTCLLLHFDNKRYIFGNICEGTQRTLMQRKIGFTKVEDIFVAGPVNWRNAGGLLGTVLCVADSLAAAKESARLSTKRSKRKKIDEIQSKLRVHGGKNISHLLATARRFIFRKGLPLIPHEVHKDPRPTEPASKPDWQDSNINVWYIPLQPASDTHARPQKRTHDEFVEAAEPSTSPSDDEDSRRLVETVVTQMFDSSWKMDALIETTLHQAKLPAKLFFRDDNGHIQVYTGPLPGSGREVPDIPVLVHQPWPGTMVASLPRTSPSYQSMCYIVKSYDRRGRFNPQVATEHGVDRCDFKLLTNGQSVVGKDGVVVTPAMVLGETVSGSGFAIVDLPDTSYVDSLVNRAEWSDETIMKGIEAIFWNLGHEVESDPRLQYFMKTRSSIKHIVCSADICPNMIALESVATQSYKLRCIDPDRFRIPVFSNELSLSNTPINKASDIYEAGRAGKTIQFAPQFLYLDDKIVPFPDIRKLAEAGRKLEVLELAAQARARVSDPEFLAKIEKVESDIPHRDAEVISLGTGSAQPSKYRSVSATLVCVPGCGNYLFDCGENTLGQLRRVFGDGLPEVLRNLKGIWISHLHADHHLGTATVIKAWHEETSQSNPSAKLLVASHRHMIDWLREYADIENYGFDRLVKTAFSSSFPGTRICAPRVLTEEERELFGLVRIDACFVSHCFGSLATVFTFPSGLKVSYSGDCRPSPDFVQIGKGTTLLIHESTFDDELQGDAIAKKHSTMSEAIDVGRRMGARRILLTHFSQRYQKVPIMKESMEIPVDSEGDEKAELDTVVLLAFDYMRVKLGDFRKAQAFLPAIQKLFEDIGDQ
ncbi:beta-lactamase-like protein [Durotheca rogersii]|uniref:beta-lactamase-like protein n=1 Tax=Durotheca rogersii TaxID=419775 RepID=UPI00221E8127|nr:beta-lactamase-like protein [Durotheca rogersii]KAI5864544.1 beta-lactamase-like protein [Durotheca rogersii]